MDAPIRVQQKRTKGWKMPENTVSVTRPGKWGNPFKVEISAEGTLSAYKAWLNGEYKPVDAPSPPTKESIIYHLKGKNLACFCPLDQPCHADILLELANKP
jgi:hypothetical protein